LNTAPHAFSAEGGDGAWMRQEKRRLLPDVGDQFIEIVGSWRTAAREIFIEGAALVRRP
jgi:hypothetical protein